MTAKPNHADREHSIWSASATDRNVNCKGALAVTIDLPESTSEAADWGTCAHQIAEACLRNGHEALEFIGRMVKGKKHEFECDEEMADTAQQYVDYVLDRMQAYHAETGDEATLWIEEKFSLAALKPPFEAGGTGDAVIFFPKWKLLEVVDLKGGRGVVVEVKGNMQARSYGLGAMLMHPKLDIQKVRSTIVQPRANHPDGRIRSEKLHVADLSEWTTDLVDAMHLSKQAMDEYQDVKAGKTPLAVWAAKWLKAGDHCKFCKFAGPCPALEQRALDAAGVWFDDLDQPRISNTPDMLSPERLAALLDAADMISEYVNSVRAYGHAQAESGVKIPNYILVDKEGREKWNGEDAEAAAVKLAKGAGLADDKIYNAPKTRTPKQIREALKKLKAADALKKIVAYSSAPKTGTNLVRENKTTRQAVPASVEKHFSVLE